jgi:hypothetical protein
LASLWTFGANFSRFIESKIMPRTMSLTRSSWPAAVLLSLCTLSDAWAMRRSAGSSVHQAEHVAIELRQSGAQNKFDKRQETELVCPDDRYQEFLDNNPKDRIETFCNEWLGISPTTVVVEYTPTMYVDPCIVCDSAYTSQHHHD